MQKFIKAFLVFSFILALDCLNVRAQILPRFTNDNLTEFHYRVKQFNEFSDRFNFEADHIGNKISEEKAPRLTRNILLSTLFDQSDPRLNPENDAYSLEYLTLAKSFINYVCEENIFIDKHSENIYTRAICTGTYHKSEIGFSIILQQERVGKGMLKWVVKDLEANFLEFLEEDTVMLRFLPPSADKLDFMELRRALSDSTHLDGYSSRDFEYDPLSVFYFLLYKGDVKLESILEVEYIIRDIPGYKITLKDFNRSSNNSGWLIRDLRKVDI